MVQSHVKNVKIQNCTLYSDYQLYFLFPGEVVANYVGFYLLWYIVMILELQFAFTAMSVRARFAAVNDALALTARNVSIPRKLIILIF